MEAMGLRLFGDVYRGRRVLLTGHTGFKGSWLALWLRHLGAELSALALPPEASPNHWELLELALEERFLDIRDAGALEQAVVSARPEIVFHLAAQPLVRRSYRQPLDTWSTNVMGTANLLQACRAVVGLRAVVVVTTDKCYQNEEWPWGYRETDRLGGYEPYSASKAAAELLCASYRSAFFSSADAPLLATARAGNVVGGGDWSEDRLVPDLVRAIGEGRSVEIRSPHATRPWQHVLESLSGYLLLGQRLLQGGREFAEAWNFGPQCEGNRTVAEVLRVFGKHWPELQWHTGATPQPHETTLLYLDSSKALARLQWRPVWGFEDALAATADWYRAWWRTGRPVSEAQLAQYEQAAQRQAASWADP